MRTSAIAAAATALALAACTLGTRPATFEPARSPQGIEARIGYWGPRHTVLALVGELLAVTDSGLVVLSADRRLVHAHWPVLASATFRQIGVRLHGGGAPVLITPGRRRAGDAAPAEPNTVIMLDGAARFMGVDPEGVEIFWGANLGTDREEAIAGPLGEVRDEIVRRRLALRAATGWVMDVYLLRRPAASTDEGG